MALKKMRSVVLFLIVLSLSVSCEWFGKKEDKIERSLLIYIAGNNNLSSYGIKNINDIKSSPFVPQYFEKGDPGDVLMIMSHLSGEIPRLKRIYMDKFGKVQEEILAEYPESSSVDPNTVEQVLKYAQTLFPAKEQGVVFWSHGTGWLPEGFYEKPVETSFGYEQGAEIDIIELAEAVRLDKTKYSYIIFDACLMGGVEVACEFSPAADYMIASVTEILANGFPYAKVVQDIFSTTDPLEVRLKTLAEDYFSYYSESSNPAATVSLINLTKIDQLASAMKSIYDKDRGRIASLDVSKIQRFYRSNKHWFYDLEDFAKAISTDTSDVENLEKALENVVEVQLSTPYFLGVEIDKHCGLSTYIPNPKNSYLDNYYKGFLWNQKVSLIQ